MNWDVVIGVGIGAVVLFYITFTLVIAERIRRANKIQAMEDWIDQVEMAIHYPVDERRS